MGVNRFMSPVKTQYIQTAVDQHVPMPFELMQKKAESEQKHFDDNMANKDALIEKMGEDMLTLDNPMQQYAIGDLTERIDKAIEGYGGDWRQMDNVIRNVGGEYNAFMKTGVGALGKNNKALHDQSYAAIDESNMRSGNKDLIKRYNDTMYEQTGGAVNGGVYTALAPGHVNEDLNTTVLDAFKAMKQDGREDAVTAYSNGEKLIIDNQQGWKGIDKKRYVDKVRGIVEADGDWLDMTQKELTAKQGLGMVDSEMTIEDYREYQMQTQFLGLAEGEAHRVYTEKQTSKESAIAVNKEKREAENHEPAISRSRRVGSGENALSDYYRDTKNNPNDTPGAATTKRKNQIFKGVFDEVVGAMDMENYGTPADAYKALNTAIGGGYDFNSPDDLERFTYDVESGAIDLSKAIASNLVPSDIVEKSRDAIHAINQDELLELDLLKKGLAEGKAGITKEFVKSRENALEKHKVLKERNHAIIESTNSSPQQKTYAGSSNKLLGLYEQKAKLVVQLDRAKEKAGSNEGIQGYLWGATTPEVDKIEEQLKYLNDSAFTLESTMKDIERSGNVSQEMIDIVTETRAAKTEKEDMRKIRSYLDTEKTNASMRTHNSKVNMTGVSLSDANSSLTGTQVKGINNLIKANTDDLLRSEVTYGNGQKGTLEAALNYEADQLINKGQLDPKKRQAWFESKKAGIKSSTPTFINAHANDNNLSMMVGGYMVDLGNEPTQFNVPGLMESFSPDYKRNAWVNGQIVQAFQSPGRTYSVPGMEGVSVVTPFATGKEQTTSDYQVTVQPGMYGLSGDKNIIVPKQYSELFLKTMKNMEEIANRSDGFVKTNGERLPLKEAQAKYIKTLY